MSVDLEKAFNVHLFGRGTQPIVFAHGLGCDQNMWRYVTPAFEEDYKIILFNYIGSNNTDLSLFCPEKYATLNDYANDVIAICKELQLENVILVGHSVSCMIGLLAAISQPQLFSNLVMVAPSPYYMNDGDYRGGFEKAEVEQLLAVMEKNMQKWANLFAPKIMGNEERTELSGELCDSFCAVDPQITQHFARVTFYADNRKDLLKMTTPSLILQCQEDILAPVEVGEYIHSQTPESTLRIMNATGHCPHLSAPEETITLIKEYLEG